MKVKIIRRTGREHKKKKFSSNFLRSDHQTAHERQLLRLLRRLYTSQNVHINVRSSSFINILYISSPHISWLYFFLYRKRMLLIFLFFCLSLLYLMKMKAPRETLQLKHVYITLMMMWKLESDGRSELMKFHRDLEFQIQVSCCRQHRNLIMIKFLSFLFSCCWFFVVCSTINSAANSGWVISKEKVFFNEKFMEFVLCRNANKLLSNSNWTLNRITFSVDWLKSRPSLLISQCKPEENFSTRPDF